MTRDRTPQEGRQEPWSTAASGVPPLTVRLLGGFRAERADLGPLPERWRRPGARTVVKLLALTPGHRLHRDQVTEACWPGTDPQTARRSLRVSLHAARHTLEPELAPRGRSIYLSTDGELLSLVADTVRVDLVEAEKAAARGLATGDPVALGASWETLGQELLPEDRYADWAAARRRELSSLWRRVAAGLADAHTAAGHPAAAAEVLERAVAGEDVDEPLHRQLLALCLASGERTRAVEHYYRLRHRLDEELGLTPEPETEELFRRAVGAVPATRPWAPAMPSAPADRIRSRSHRPAGPSHAATAGALAVPAPPSHGAALRAPSPGRALPGPAAPSPGPVLPAAVLRATTTPLRGRDTTLAAALARIMPGRAAAPLTVVSGESGVGKTRLVAEVSRVAAEKGTTVLWGAAHEAEGPLPYGPFGDALSGWLAGLARSERTEVAACHPELGRLLPELGFDPPRAGTAEEERARLFHTVGALLAQLAADRPVLVIVDDLHAADLGTLRLLHHLARTAGGRPVRFLATLREEHLDEGDERRTVLRAATRQGLLHRIELMRLTRADCDRVAADVARSRAGMSGPDGDLGPELLETVYRLSRGNPLFVTELVRAVAESPPDPERPEPDLDELPGFGGSVPESVREVVIARVAHFPPPARQALQVLAVAGGETALAEAAEVASEGLHPPLPGPVFAAALDTLTTARLVDECEVVQSGRRRAGLAFRHPVVGLAVYERLTAAQRRELHLAHAAAIRRHRPEAVDALAHHLDRADHPDAAVWLRRAAERAASLYADDSANRYYADLVSRLDGAAAGPEATAEAAEVRLAWAEVLVRQARHGEAESMLRMAVDALGRSRDEDGRVRAEALLAETLGRTGRPLDGIALLLRAAPGAEEADLLALSQRCPSDIGHEATATHHLTLAILWFQLGRHERAMAHADLALDAGKSAGGDLTRASGRALHVRAASLLLLGRREAASVVAEEALKAAERAGDLSLRSRVLSTLRELSTMGGRLAEATEYARRTLALAERTGDPLAIAFERAGLARVELLAGRPEAALDGARSAVDGARSFGATWGLPYCLMVLGEVELRAGRSESARRWLTEGAATAGRLDDDQAERAARVLLAEVELLDGLPHQALERLGLMMRDEDPGLDHPDSVASHGGLGDGASTVVADALLMLGRAPAAERWARRALERARRVGDRPGEVEARRVLGLALLGSGHREGAEAQLRGALRLARAMALATAEKRLRQAAGELVGD
ncbi:ATP-binding protein [Streptomyces sp. cmx-10-25]|uniref:ATP-binding protein n=1 Tax=Streptomyces sp. cmx-10-25 TaxID=2790919 RepID=UPI003981502C